jgi:hypothetical protein
MLSVINRTNPVDRTLRQEDLLKAEDGASIRQLIRRRYEQEEFPYPTIVKVNNAPWTRHRWDDPLPADAVVEFVRLSGWTFVAITIGALLVGGAVASRKAKVQKPKIKKPKKVSVPEPHHIGAFGGAAVHVTPSAAAANQNGSPVYSLTGKQNQNKKDNAIESPYGRNRIYPAYAATPHNIYAGNDQYQYSLLCLGQGYYDIEALQFDDTAINKFKDVEWEVVDPGEAFTLFPDNVETSPEVAELELFGKNEKEHTGWTQPYVVNGPFTKANRIEIDLVLPNGLYSINQETGAMISQTVQAQFQYQEINDFGAAIGTWKTLKFQRVQIVPSTRKEDIRKTQYSVREYSTFSVTLANATPQRFTLSGSVPAARYQVRGIRSNPRNRSLQAADGLKWEALRAFLPSVQDYGNVTLVAIKARASNNLNNNAAQKFNVICTRKLPTWHPTTGWTEPVITRSAIWAFVDILKAEYGGRLEDTFIDLEELYAMDQEVAAQSKFFDYIFDAKSNIWEVAKTIARVIRGVPIVNGSRISIVRDIPQTVAKAVFNAYNIIAGTFQWHLSFSTMTNYDGVEVEYMDDQNWKLETMQCLIDNDLGDFCEPIRLSGITDRQRAYSEGLFIRAQQKYGRETLSFKTGIEGNLLSYGDLVLVSHDVPRWGQGGMVLSIDETHTILTLSEPVTFAAGVYKMILRKKDGAAYGPFVVTAGESEYHVVAAAPIDMTQFYFDNAHEKPLFQFGLENIESRKCQIVGIKPDSRDTVSLELVPYDDRYYSFDSFDAPPRGSEGVRALEPALPEVASLQVNKIPGTQEFVSVSWTPALGAKSYLLQMSTNNEDWITVQTQPRVTIHILRVNREYLYLRVAGVNVDTGPFVTWEGEVGLLIKRPGTVNDLRLDINLPGLLGVTWDAEARADQYEITVYATNTGRHLRRVVQPGLTFEYSAENAEEDAYDGKNITIRVKGLNIAGLSDDPASLPLTMLEANPLVPSTSSDVDDITVDSTVTQTDEV